MQLFITLFIVVYWKTGWNIKTIKSFSRRKYQELTYHYLLKKSTWTPPNETAIIPLHVCTPGMEQNTFLPSVRLDLI